MILSGGLSISPDQSSVHITPKILQTVITLKTVKPVFVAQIELEIAHQLIIAVDFEPTLIEGFASRMVAFHPTSEVSTTDQQVSIRARVEDRWELSPEYIVKATKP